MPVRLARLNEPEPDLRESTTAAERVAMVWVLTLESWDLAGRPVPVYFRKDAPVRVVPLGSA